MVVVLSAEIGFVGEGSLEQGAIVEVVLDAFLELTQAFFPFGILLRDLFPVEVFYYAADYRFHVASNKECGCPKPNASTKGFGPGATGFIGLIGIFLDDDGRIVSTKSQGIG